MRNGLRVLVAVAFAASAAACDAGNDDVELYEGEEAATPSMEGPTTTGADAAILTAQFEAPEDAPAGSQVTGTVRVFPENGMSGEAGAGATTEQTRQPETGVPGEAETEMAATTTGEGQGFRVEVSLNGLSEGEHAWHIHSAPCGEEAPVVVAFTPTPELEGLADALSPDESGRAEAEATVPADQLSLDRLQSGEYSLHVHAQGGVDHGPTVACADLRGQGSSPTM